MKTKIDFVTNSSCASFVILKEKLTELQIYMIKHHSSIVDEYYGEIRKNYNYKNNHDWWHITENKKEISGDTSMDNFDMMWFLLQIGVREEDIDYKGCY